MTKNIYAIRDNVAMAVLGGLHMIAADAAAVRMFQDVAQAEGTQVQKHLPDFDLIQVATIDEQTGLVLANDEVRVVLHGAALADLWAAQAAQK